MHIVEIELQQLRATLVHSGFRVLVWILPLVTVASLLRIPVVGVVPEMYVTTGVTLFVIALYLFRTKIDHRLQAAAFAALGMAAAIASYHSFADPTRVVSIMMIPVLLFSCAFKREIAYLFALSVGLFPLALELASPGTRSFLQVLQGSSTHTVFAICSYSLIAHLISDRLMCFLKESRLRERKLERSDRTSGTLNEFAIREYLDQLLSSQPTPNLRLYKLYLPSLDVAISNYPHEVRKEIVVKFTQMLAPSLPDAAVFGRLRSGNFLVVGERAIWPDIEAQLRKMRTIEIEFDGKPIALDPVVITTDAPADGTESGALLDNLTRVLRRAKRDRREHAYFLPFDKANPESAYSYVSELPQAIEHGELQLYIQPKVATAVGNAIQGGEALIRWNHPKQGLLSPGAFLEQIETSNARTDFALFVIRRSAEILSQLQTLDAEFQLSFNLSAYDLQELKVLAELQRVMAVYDFKPRTLEIEISESETAVLIDSLSRSIDAVRDLGYSVSLDDFGTGMSSLAYFGMLSVDTVKIDRAFILALDNSETEYQVLRSMVALSRSAGRMTVAEGVETDKQVNIVSEMGFDQIQGYYFGRPMTLDQFIPRLEHQVKQSVNF